MNLNTFMNSRSFQLMRNGHTIHENLKIYSRFNQIYSRFISHVTRVIMRCAAQRQRAAAHRELGQDGYEKVGGNPSPFISLLRL